MQTVNSHDARAHLSRLPERGASGQETIIAKAGTAVARRVSLDALREKRRLGRLRGQLRVPDDFDKPLTTAELAPFERG